MPSRRELSDERVAELDVKMSKISLRRAREELREEIATVRDLMYVTGLPPGIRLTPDQRRSFDEALRVSLEVVEILAKTYARAGTELRVSHEP